MLRWLVSLSLRHAIVVCVLTVIAAVAGARAIRSVPFDVFPEFAPPLIEVQTEAPGLSALEVESFVSVPIESALTGVPEVATIRSKSVLGLSSVVLILTQGADLMQARQLVQERLARVSREPAGRRQRARAALAALVAEPRAEDRHDVEDAVADGADDGRAVDDSAAADGGAGRRERRDLGPARSAAAGARRSGSAARAARSRWPRS